MAMPVLNCSQQWICLSLKVGSHIHESRYSYTNTEISSDGHIKLSVFYQQRCRQVDLDSQNWHLPANVIPCSDPNGSLDFNAASNEATAAFFKCVPPDTPFMPAQEEQETVEDDY